MVLFSEMFFSELLDVRVIDRNEEPVGEVVDALVFLGEQFPRVSGLLIKTPNGKKEVLTMGEVDLMGRRFISTKTTIDRIVLAPLREAEVLLKRNVLDQQVVDTSGARVLRVNDVKLAKVGGDVRVIAVDVGISGILRRLGLERAASFLSGLLKKKIPEILIGWNFIELLEADLKKGRITIPHKRVEELHPSDIADIMSHVHTEERQAIFASLSEKTASEALHELEPKIQAMLLLTVDTKKALGILNKMPVDEAADVLGDLPGEKTEEFLMLMRPRKAQSIRKLLKHPDETAGGLMTTEFLTIPANITCEQTIDRLRQNVPDAETIYYLYVVDADGKLVGVLSLRALITSPPSAVVSDIMVKDSITVPATANQKQVADMISKYNLLAIPVVDESEKMIGIVTVDDVVDFILPPISRRKRQMIG